MSGAGKLKTAVLLFLLAFSVRVGFYILGSLYLPQNFQKFVTADTVFYYDPMALKTMPVENSDTSFLSATRVTFLSYLGLFYRIFGYHHLPVSLFHCFLGAMSAVLLFLTAGLFLKEREAFFIGLAAALQIVIIYWTPFVNTEASYLFILSLAIFLFALFIKKQQPIYALFLFLALMLIFFTRPQGMFFSVFMFLFALWLILKRYFRLKARMYFLLICASLLIMSGAAFKIYAQKINKIIAQAYPEELLQMSFYIDEMPQAVKGRNNFRLYAARITLPPGISIPKTKGVLEKITVDGILAYLKNHPKKYFTLIIARLYTLFNPWVPEYSLRHNLANVIFYGAVYILSFIGMIKLWKANITFAFLITLALFSQVLPVVLTVVDYDFRLRLPVELLFCIPIGMALGWQRE